MNDNALLLLRALLLSTSQFNMLKHCNDRKKRGKIIGGIVGKGFLYAMLIGYSLLTSIGYGFVGIIDSTPMLCALTISALAAVFTFLKTNGYLFNFKEYDMLMSLPFEAKTVAGCKFLYMYVQSMPWYLCISVSMLIGYGWFVHPSVIVYLAWLILTQFIPIIPMLAAAFAGFLIAKVSSGFKKTNIIETVFMTIVVLLGFGSRFFFENMFKNGEVEATLETLSDTTGKAGSVYLPAGWFANAITDESVLSALLLIGVSVALFMVVFRIVGASYRNINSAFKSHAAAKSFTMSAQKRRPVAQAIAFKEFKRFTESSVYMTNAGVGEVLATIFGVATLIIGFDDIIKLVTQNAPFDSSILRPAIPFIVYFLIGMMATTACSPSLEGKNYWIIQSLPIEKKALYQGKMLFNMCLTVPFMAFSTLCLCISAKVPVLEALLYLALGVALCAFSTAWGCVCGIKFMRLDWENEIEVIKQGAAVAIYLLPNMFVTMGLTVLVVILGLYVNHVTLTLVMITIVTVLAGLSYKLALHLGEKQ